MSRSGAAAAPASAPGYVHAASGYDEELARLQLLQARSDGRTFARLTRFGSLAGEVCLEVGAGAGSVARWLAVQAGPSGRVVATDADPRFLAGHELAGVEVRRHDPPHRRSSCFDMTMRKLLAFIAVGRAFDPFFGRCLPGLFASVNLADAGHEAIACHRRGGDSAAEVLARSLERTCGQALGRADVGPGEFAAVLSALRDPSFSFIDALSVAAWGRPG